VATGDEYQILVGRETALSINTPATIYMNLFDDRLTIIMQRNRNNANMTVKDAIHEANRESQQQNGTNAFMYGEMLKNRN
jgi:dihydrofolate reductase